jgi:hypothetical protein
VKTSSAIAAQEVTESLGDAQGLARSGSSAARGSSKSAAPFGAVRLTTAHPAQPTGIDAEADALLRQDDAGLGLGAVMMLAAGGPNRPNFAALGRLIRAGIAALGATQARAEVVAMARRGRPR